MLAQMGNQLHGQTGLSRVPGAPGSDVSRLSPQETEQLALLRQLQLSGSLQASFGNAGTAGPPNAFGSVSSAPGGSFRAPSPLVVGGHRTSSPAFGTSFGGGTVSPAYSTTSLPGALNLHSRPGSAFGQTGIGGGMIATDPVIRRPSPTPSIASHASKQGTACKSHSIILITRLALVGLKFATSMSCHKLTRQLVALSPLCSHANPLVC